MFGHITNTGLSVAYEVENCPPIVDIVFVHGLQGHPFKTWTDHSKSPDTLELPALTGKKEEKRSGIRRMLRNSLKASSTSTTQSTVATISESNGSQHKPVFWPADLLPKECPNSRILTFGYDSKVTKYTAGAINQNGILSHSKDLLFALCRERNVPRPLVFVAHSLGGIVVKEMLARSSSSLEAEHRNIVESTAAVVFLGTPHRGSQDVAALGEVVRSIVSSFGMETTPIILDALGLKTSDLERAQEDFSRLWQKYDFQVKTFQEGLSLAKIGKKVVPDYSSLIGDHREHAETLQANHIEMCRYSGKDDPNYRKVSGELNLIYYSIARIKVIEALPTRQKQIPTSILSATSTKVLLGNIASDQLYEACLGSLWFPAINIRYQSLEKPANETCSWLFSHDLYRDWFNSRSRQESCGLLWLKGKPGSGKSTLMKEAFRRAALEQIESNYSTAAFFFSAKGDTLEHSSLGLFRSLLYQLLPGDRESLQRFHKIWDDQSKLMRRSTTEELPPSIWTEPELKAFFESMLISQTRRTIIFVDALDECDESMIRPMAYFWRTITKSAYDLGADLSVCLSSRHFPTITIDGCPEIIVEQHNSDDIRAYVNEKFRVCVATEERGWERLILTILRKSNGVFLWVVLVVEGVLKNWDDGNGMPYLTKLVQDIPKELETLFSDMFSKLGSDGKQIVAKLFQWAILATKPLSLHEWHHVMAFIWQPTLISLRQWRQSVYFTDSDEQLERQIRRVSKGLLEVKKVRVGDSQDEGVELLSTHAGAGSLDRDQGNTRIVQVIHESVRDFFLKSNGFSIIDSSLRINPIGNGHLAIMNTCLDYLNIAELDGLVTARINSARREGVRKFLANDLAGPHNTNSSTHANNTTKRNLMSHKERQTQHSKRSAIREENASMFEMLRSLDYTPGMNIVEWMAKEDAVPGEPSSSNRPLCESETHSSQLSRSQILEDDPALLSYATFRLFTHARLAERCEVDPTPVVKRLSDRATWVRWVTLREDIPERTEMLNYAVDRGLFSWTKASDELAGAFAAENVIDFDGMIHQDSAQSPQIGSKYTSQSLRQRNRDARTKRELLSRRQRLKETNACDHCRRRKLRCVSLEYETRCIYCIRLGKECIPDKQQSNILPDVRQSNPYADTQQPDTANPASLNWQSNVFTSTHENVSRSDLLQSNNISTTIDTFSGQSPSMAHYASSSSSSSVPSRPGSVASFSSAVSHRA